jgi:hypothetical protein
MQTNKCDNCGGLGKSPGIGGMRHTCRFCDGLGYKREVMTDTKVTEKKVKRSNKKDK